MLDKALPFPRGKTLCDGVITPTSTSHMEYCGREYRVRDTVHGTAEEVVLVPLKLESAVTAARKLYKFGTTALDFGRTTGGVADSAGMICLALDDAYTVGQSLAQYDVAWFVKRGPVSLQKGAKNHTQFGPLANDTSGRAEAATAGEACIIGVADAASSEAAATVVVVHMDVTLGTGT